MADGAKVARKTAGGAGGSGGGKPRKKPTAGGGAGTGDGSGAQEGGGPSTSGAGGSRGKKRGRDGDGDDDDPNKRRKTGDGGKQPKPQVARKEPRKKGVAYPPIDRKLPPLYISRPKERTELGHRVLDWTAEQKRKIHEARMQGRRIKPHRYRAGTVALKGHPSLPREHGVAHPKVAFPVGSKGNRSGYQDGPAVQASYYHAKRHSTGKTKSGESVRKVPPQNTFLVLFRTTTYSKRSNP